MAAGVRSFAVILVALILAAAAQSSTIILCIGTGGHFAIEQVDSGCCARAANRDSGPLGVQGDRCADHCVDTPISVSAACGTTERSCRTSAVVLPSVAVPTRTTVGFNPLGASRQASLVPISPPRVLRTTINLC